MQKIFNTSYGQVAIVPGAIIHDSEGGIFVQYECQVLTPLGIIHTPSIYVGLEESLTQEHVEQVASVVSPKGRTANRAKNHAIREFIHNQKFNN